MREFSRQDSGLPGGTGAVMLTVRRRTGGHAVVGGCVALGFCAKPLHTAFVTAPALALLGVDQHAVRRVHPDFHVVEPLDRSLDHQVPTRVEREVAVIGNKRPVQVNAWAVVDPEDGELVLLSADPFDGTIEDDRTEAVQHVLHIRPRRRGEENRDQGDENVQNSEQSSAAIHNRLLFFLAFSSATHRGTYLPNTIHLKYIYANPCKHLV